MISAYETENSFDASIKCKVLFSTGRRLVGFSHYTLSADPNTVKYFLNVVERQLSLIKIFVPFKEQVFCFTVLEIYWDLLRLFNIGSNFCSIAFANQDEHFSKPDSFNTTLTDRSWMWSRWGNHFIIKLRVIIPIKAERRNSLFLRS